MRKACHIKFFHYILVHTGIDSVKPSLADKTNSRKPVGKIFKVRASFFLLDNKYRHCFPESNRGCNVADVHEYIFPDRCAVPQVVYQQHHHKECGADVDKAVCDSVPFSVCGELAFEFESDVLSEYIGQLVLAVLSHIVKSHGQIDLVFVRDKLERASDPIHKIIAGTGVTDK